MITRTEKDRLQRALGMIEAVQVLVKKDKADVLWCAARIIETVLYGDEKEGEKR